MNFRAILFFVLFLPFYSFTQIEVTVNPKVIESLDSIRVQRNESLGYRIQICFDSDKTIVDNYKIKFIELYPKTDCYISFDAPNFNLMVGDYRTLIEAEVVKEKIQGKFPLCIIHKEKIKLPRID